MTRLDRTLIGALVAGVWALVALQATSMSHAQESASETTGPEERATVVHASDIVGLSAFVQKAIRDHQYRPQSMPGLDQYIRSVVRNCRINGSVSGNRLSGTSISC